MNIENNIIKHNLKNVYFICGTACGGKTKMSKMLAEKHGFYLYDMDKHYSEHRPIAQEEHQPDMCYHGKNFHEQCIEEQSRWSINSLKEQSEMVLIDLMKLSENQKVVADVLFTTDYLKGIVDYNQIVFLTADKQLIRDIYFNRPEKREFYEFVKAQKLADTYFERIFQSLELTNIKEKGLMEGSKFLIIDRTEDSTVKKTFEIIEKHFGLL